MLYGRRVRQSRSCSAEAGAMLEGFRKFIMRGNVVDLAVAVVIGAAFTLVVNSLVADIINPILAAIVGKPDFSDLTISIRDATITYGNFITAVINFLLVAAAIYFLIVMPMNRMQERLERGKGTVDPETKQCPECLSVIPIAATRCAFCGIDLTGKASPDAPAPAPA
jgi:large conductance mechanosensitive channel